MYAKQLRRQTRFDAADGGVDRNDMEFQETKASRGFGYK